MRAIMGSAMANAEDERKKLLDLLAKVPQKADEQEKIGKAIQESAQQARDIAIPFREIIEDTGCKHSSCGVGP